MSDAARTALAATAVFAVSGVLSGLLIDEDGGAAGAPPPRCAPTQPAIST